MSKVFTSSDKPIPTAEQAEQQSAEELLEEAEPWASWETHLVGWSIGTGIVGLIILGWLVNTFLLP